MQKPTNLDKLFKANRPGGSTKACVQSLRAALDGLDKLYDDKESIWPFKTQAQVAGINVTTGNFANENRTKTIHTWTPMVPELTYVSGHSNFTAVGHGLKNGDKVLFTDVGLAALTAGNKNQNFNIKGPYYVVNVTTNTFKLSKTKGGTALAAGTDPDDKDPIPKNQLLNMQIKKQDTFWTVLFRAVHGGKLQEVMDKMSVFGQRLLKMVLTFAVHVAHHFLTSLGVKELLKPEVIRAYDNYADIITTPNTAIKAIEAASNKEEAFREQAKAPKGKLPKRLIKSEKAAREKICDNSQKLEKLKFCNVPTLGGGGKKRETTWQSFRRCSTHFEKNIYGLQKARFTKAPVRAGMAARRAFALAHGDAGAAGDAERPRTPDRP